MKHYFSLLLFFLFGGIHFAQTDGNAFKSGEILKFKVRYGIFNASYATLHLKNNSYEGKSVFHAVGKGRTTGLAKLFFKVDDTYESFFDKQNGNPVFAIRNIYEGGYTKKLHFLFNGNNQVKIKNIETNSEKTISIGAQVKDVISAFYHFRNSPKMNQLQKNEEIGLDMIFDDDDIFKFRLRFLGKERLETKFGEIETLVFRPLVQNGRVFKEQESLTLWVTNDANKVPVKVKASLRVGSLVAELDDFQELKFPTELKKE